MQLRKMLSLTLAFCLVAMLQSALKAEKVLLVGSKETDKVLKYDLDGNYISDFATASDGTYAGGTFMNEPTDIQIGPDGNVYIAFRDEVNTFSQGGIACYSPEGVYQGMFTDSTAYGSIMNFAFDSNGDVIAGYFNGSTYTMKKINGIYSGDDAGSLVGDLGRNAIGLVCDPNYAGKYFCGHSISGGGKVLWDDTDTTTAAVTSVFAGPVGALTNVQDLEFASDGKLYAIACNNNYMQSIYVYDPEATNPAFEFLATYTDSDPDLKLALGMAFDDDGNLLVANLYGDCVSVFCTADGTYDGVTYAKGDYMGNLIESGVGGLDGPYYGLVVLNAVPEPSTFALLSSALFGLLIWRRKK